MMWRVALLAAIVGLAPCPFASAETNDGFAALAVAALVGERSPALSVTERGILRGYLDGQAAGSGRLRIRVTSDAVTCNARNDDLTAYSCDLTFGSADIAIQGHAAQNLFTTLAQAGVPADRSAGNIYEGVTNLSCTIDTEQIGQNSGAGAHCDYEPG
jgi:hypothetical protein